VRLVKKEVWNLDKFGVFSLGEVWDRSGTYGWSCEGGSLERMMIVSGEV
jgi:hypothetical protein